MFDCLTKAFEVKSEKQILFNWIVNWTFFNNKPLKTFESSSLFKTHYQLNMHRFHNCECSFAHKFFVFRFVKAGGNQNVYTFTVPYDGCGSKASCSVCASVDNILVIQSDETITENWDTARRITCTTAETTEKTIYFKPFVGEKLSRRNEFKWFLNIDFFFTQSTCLRFVMFAHL